MSDVISIKNTIKAKLDALVTGGTLAGATSVISDKDVMKFDIPNFPWAFLGPGKLNNRAETNRDNTYSYTFGILVVVKPENLTDTTTVEGLMEAIARAFDNIPTLSGFANAGLNPAVGDLAVIEHKNGELLVFSIGLTANATESLTF